jgi:D-beta-D-heptose 7-phosphate kinase/D-beta-D-heptose 1-phosphate adenosyltransferase
MLAEFGPIIESFTDCNVLVIGEAMLDSYLHGSSTRLCREAPVPIVDVSKRIDMPGGAANTAVNIHSLGAHVAFLSVLGDDFEGNLLRQALEQCSVRTEYMLVDPSRRTLAKHRVLAGSEMLVRFDHGSTDPVDEEHERLLCASLRELWEQCSAVIVSDYGYGIMTPRVIDLLAELQAQSPRILTVDSKCLTAYRHVGVTAIKPNYDEVVQLLGVSAPGGVRADWIADCEERILEMTGTRIAAVTLDTEGALIFERGCLPYRTVAQPTMPAYPAGAGDTFLSTLTLALAAKADTITAAELASAAAAIVVAKQGTAVCSANELWALSSGACALPFFQVVPSERDVG